MYQEEWGIWGDREVRKFVMLHLLVFERTCVNTHKLEYLLNTWRSHVLIKLQMIFKWTWFIISSFSKNVYNFT